MFGINLIPTWAYWTAIGVLSAAVGAQQVRVSNAHADLSQEKTERAEETAERVQLVLDHELSIKSILATHTAAQQTKDDIYVAKVLELKDAAVRNAADARGLRLKLEAFTSGARQPGETDAAACERAQYRLGAVGNLLAEGVELEAESRAIIERRDAEVERLKGQVAIDRAALE